jgi:hypothetical protein
VTVADAVALQGREEHQHDRAGSVTIFAKARGRREGSMGALVDDTLIWHAATGDSMVLPHAYLA